jgi:menaquinone-dependent protoporphyrinogen IX oxidase
MQGAIVYKGKYGATRDYATLLSTALNLPVSNETLTGGQLLHADYLFIGSAVYAGRLSLRKAGLKLRVVNGEWQV